MHEKVRTKRGLRPTMAAERLGVSLPTFWRYARLIEDFPKLIKISSAVTVIDADELEQFIARRQTGISPRAVVKPEVNTKDAAAALGCRLVSDLTPAELVAWTAAGRPGRVVLGDCEVVTIKAIRRLTTAPVLATAPATTGRTRRKGAAEPATV